MNASALILVTVMFCVSFTNCSVIRRPETHTIRKRSTADHGIADVKARQRTIAERQLVLTQLINSINTKGDLPIPTSVEPEQETTTILATTSTSKPRRSHHKHNGRERHQKKRRNRIPRSVQRSVSSILRSEHGEEIVEAIANIISKDDLKTVNAFQRIRKFAKSSSCTCMKG